MFSKQIFGKKLVVKGSVPFIIKVKTDNAGTSGTNQFTIPTWSTNYFYNYYVKTSDGQELGTVANGFSGNTTLTFPTAGEYDIEIHGIFPAIRFNFSGDRLKLIEIKQWGNIEWGSFNYAFQGCQNMVGTYTDKPNLTNVTNLEGAFYACNNFNGAVNNWNISSVTTLEKLFWECYAFNQPLNNWNTSNVTNMTQVFFKASIFNQPLNNWNTSNVTNMTAMFNGAPRFNQDIGMWDVSKVTSFQQMFRGGDFNQDITGWNIGSASLRGMFWSTGSVFDQDISTWDIKDVTDMFTFMHQKNIFSYLTECYIAWSQLPYMTYSGDVHFGNIKYRAEAAAARQSLIDNFGWNIVDGGQI